MPSGLQEAISDLLRIRNLFNFTVPTPGDHMPLGEATAEVIAGGIYQMMDMECDADGKPWDKLSFGYRTWKEKEYPGRPISVLTGHMKTLDQLKGELVISDDSLKQTYGLDEEAKTTAFSFQEGGQGGGAPPRSFYAFNPIVIARLEEHFDRHFDAVTDFL